MKIGMIKVNDLINPPHPGSKLFEEPILDFDISPILWTGENSNF